LAGAAAANTRKYFEWSGEERATPKVFDNRGPSSLIKTFVEEKDTQEMDELLFAALAPSIVRHCAFLCCVEASAMLFILYFDFIELMIFFNQLFEIFRSKTGAKRKEKCSARGEDLYREAMEKEVFGWILDIKPEPKEHYGEQGLFVPLREREIVIPLRRLLCFVLSTRNLFSWSFYCFAFFAIKRHFGWAMVLNILVAP
jgi:hypothetical protein